ncbi:MAG: metallopeptidase TldD-related protein [Neomegalonema sp.]|nr:metallopeptidase TldD-related protein [Neomegalonema sp.]
MTDANSSNAPVGSRFDPFGDALDAEAARAVLAGACSGADDGEIFFERRRSEALSFDDGRLAAANYDASEGFGLRVVRGEAVGYAHSPEISLAALKRAGDAAALAARGGGGSLAGGPTATNNRPYGDADPIAEANFAVKAELLRELDGWARALDPRIVQVSASMAGGLQEIEILRPDGAHIRDARPMTRCSVSVIVEENGRRETGSAGGGGRRGYGDVVTGDDLKTMAKEALRVALVNLEAQEAPAGVFEVALGPGWCGVLLHEAVGHGLEGDFNRKKTSAFAGLMGEMVASKGVTVVDDGVIADARGSLAIDDEGTAAQRNVLIEDGKLVGYMQDRQNARLMGVTPTGNGRRQSYAHAPMPRMTNTFMLGGDANPEEIVATIKDGVYAVKFGGGQVDITSGKFVFNCTEAYRVKNGKKLHPIKGMTLVGDGPSALRQVRIIGNDSELDPGIGMCGKRGQSVPVTVGQPTMLIDGLTIGGRGA